MIQSRLEQAVKLGQRQLFGRSGSDFLSIDCYFIRLRIYSKLRWAVVPYHSLLADIATAVYRDNVFFQSVSIFYACVKGSLRNKGQAGFLFCFSMSGKHWLLADRLCCRDGSIGISHFGSNNHAAFDDHIRFGTEESGIPEHEICRMILTAIWHILSDLKSYTPEGFLESRPVKEEKILSTSQALNLLRQRGYVIKDEPLTVSGLVLRLYLVFKPAF